MSAARVLRPTLATAALASLAAWLAAPLPDAWRTAAIDLGWTLLSLLVAAAAVAASRRPEQRDARAALRFVAAGAIAWSAGQAAWTWVELGEGALPYPAAGDVGFIAALPLLALAVLCWPRAERSWSAGDLADAALMVSAVLLASYVFVIEPVVAQGLNDRADLVLVAYPLVDALLLGALLVGITLHTFLQPGRLLVLALGLLALVAADTHYAVRGADYVTGASVWELGWTCGFALIGTAALLPASWSARFRLPASAGPLAVIGLLAAAGAFTALHEHAGAPHRHELGNLLMLALFVALAFRYVVVARRRLHEAEHLERARAALEHEYRILDATVEASRTGMCLYSADGQPIVRNRSWTRLLGDEAELSGALGAIAADDRVRVAGPDGRSLLLASHALETGERLVTIDDVTEEVREREARGRLLAEVVGAQDLEARRIAEVLHDDVVQRLTALGLRLELASLRTGQDALLELAREAGAVTASIRRLLIELHPAVLESQGLAAAIDAAAGSLRSVGVTVEVDELDLRLAPELEALAYRLAQEAFANVLKHARAERVGVTLAAEEGFLRCEVADDGAGFETDTAATAIRRGSLGLHLVRERIELAGGRFRLESEPGRGTRLAFELPLDLAVERRPAAEAVA